MRFSDRNQQLSLTATAIAVAAAILLVAPGAGASSSKKVKVGNVLAVISSAVTIHGKPVEDGQTLYAGDTIHTDPAGDVHFKLRSGATILDCESFSARYHARTYTTNVSLTGIASTPLAWKGGGTTCSKKGKQSVAPKAPSAVLHMVDPVFVVEVFGKTTIVRVKRGVIAVSGTAATSPSQAVVIGRNQQATITSGTASQPTTIGQLSAKEKSSLNVVSANLPPLTDTTGPAMVLNGPHDPSSLRSADFTFTSEERNVTYSCNLDNAGAHLCTSPQHFEALAPVPHTFTVEALDMNGNRTTQTWKWTIDTSRIAYASDAAGHFNIYTMNPDGSDQQQLTNDKTDKSDNEDPAWSPDRKEIAFHSDRSGIYEIYVMNPDGSGLTQLTRDKLPDRNPSWSPDGKELVFERGATGSRQLYVMNADGTNVRQLTNTATGENFDPAWSPDGTRIAFASSRDGNDEIYVMNADGSNQTNLTNNPATEFNPAWSPDSKQIAFHSLRDESTQQIYIMNADGSNPVRVSKTSMDDYNPTWAPDGGEVAFQSNLDSNPKMAIWVMGTDGSGRIRLTPKTSNALEPDWGLPTKG